MSATPATLSPWKDQVQARRLTLGWSQNELARRISKDPGLVSRVLNGTVTSSVVVGRIEKALAREERRRGLAKAS
jgi:ribosome-binding protein aMBF1 (putative translation factor)